MRILSASEAISPAVDRTKLLLFTPFRWGRTWKLGVTGYLSFVGGFFLPLGLIYMAAAPLAGQVGGRRAELAVIVGSLGITVFFLVVFLLCSRLQFAFFDITLNRGEFVAPAWHKYARISGPWTLIKLAIGVLASALIAIPLFPLIRSMGPALASLGAAMKDIKPGQPPDPQIFNFMAGLYGGYFLLMAFLAVYFFVMSSLSAFMVPSMALESMTPKQSFLRFLAFVKRETGAFFFFVFLRFGIAIVAYFAITIAAELVLLILLAIVGVVGFLIGLALHAIGVPSGVLFGIGVPLAILVFAAHWGYVLGIGMGCFYTFFEAHTLYFLGGRYPMLGQLLEASTPPPPPAPPTPSFGGPRQWDASLYNPPPS